ncbi:hypothetical protein D9757_010998 [Collybiopsis confluens]|uniref:Uncharacterized protein n=1 Tax=Collybiopsis confluens TaxID=2823264 RepID=A0A8H5GDL9_9AGAR|nr:hypothetical protein D9757_010998 [Collybiopsis confluens]
MSYDLVSSASFPMSTRILTGSLSLEASKVPLHVRARSPSTSSSTSSDNTSEISTTSSVNSYSSACSTSYDPRRRISALINGPQLLSRPVLISSKPKPRPSKVSTEHILVRARNANVPAMQRHYSKKSSLAAAAQRQAQRYSDYEEDHCSSDNQRPAKKPKTKSTEQVEAEQHRMLDRKAELEDDPLLDATKMCPGQVWCIPCQKYIRIDSRRQYYATLWFKHRGKRHPGVPLTSQTVAASSDVDVEMDSEVPSKEEIESPVALAVPVIDDATATNILADMYSMTQGLRILSLAAASLG